jgi:hypothetical protein
MIAEFGVVFGMEDAVLIEKEEGRKTEDAARIKDGAMTVGEKETLVKKEIAQTEDVLIA